MFNVFAMDEFDREMTIAEKAFDIAMAEAAYLESMIDAKLKINMAKSELKVMTESTTESAQGDLVYLFNEAGKEAEANKEGVFTKVKNAVISFFVSVWNSIQKLFTKEDTEAYKKLQASKEKIKLPMNVKFLADKGEAIANALDTQEPSEGKFGKVAKIIGATVAVGGGVAGATALIKHMGEATTQETEITKGEAVGILEKLKNMLPKFQKSVQGVNDTPNDEGGATGVLNIFKKIGEWIGKAVKAITSKLTGSDVTDTDEKNSNEPVKPTRIQAHDATDDEMTQVESGDSSVIGDPVTE